MYVKELMERLKQMNPMAEVRYKMGDQMQWSSCHVDMVEMYAKYNSEEECDGCYAMLISAEGGQVI